MVTAPAPALPDSHALPQAAAGAASTSSNSPTSFQSVYQSLPAQPGSSLDSQIPQLSNSKAAAGKKTPSKGTDDTLAVIVSPATIDPSSTRPLALSHPSFSLTEHDHATVSAPAANEPAQLSTATQETAALDRSYAHPSHPDGAEYLAKADIRSAVQLDATTSAKTDVRSSFQAGARPSLQAGTSPEFTDTVQCTIILHRCTSITSDSGSLAGSSSTADPIQIHTNSSKHDPATRDRSRVIHEGTRRHACASPGQSCLLVKNGGNKFHGAAGSASYATRDDGSQWNSGAGQKPGTHAHLPDVSERAAHNRGARQRNRRCSGSGLNGKPYLECRRHNSTGGDPH
jgi:hypothetical protein